MSITRDDDDDDGFFSIPSISLARDCARFPSLAENHSRESKKTMALRQANSVSSIWTSFIGFTSSSITLAPTRLMSTS